MSEADPGVCQAPVPAVPPRPSLPRPLSPSLPPDRRERGEKDLKSDPPDSAPKGRQHTAWGVSPR